MTIQIKGYFIAGEDKTLEFDKKIWDYFSKGNFKDVALIEISGNIGSLGYCLHTEGASVKISPKSKDITAFGLYGEKDNIFKAKQRLEETFGITLHQSK